MVRFPAPLPALLLGLLLGLAAVPARASKPTVDIEYSFKAIGRDETWFIQWYEPTPPEGNSTCQVAIGDKDTVLANPGDAQGISKGELATLVFDRPLRTEIPWNHYFRLVDKDGRSLTFRVHVAANSMEVIKVEVVESSMKPLPDAVLHHTVRISRSGITILQDSLK